MIFPSPPKTTSTGSAEQDGPVGPDGPSPFAIRQTGLFSGISSVSSVTRSRSLPSHLPPPHRQTGPSGAPAPDPASGRTGPTGPKIAEGTPAHPSALATGPNRRVKAVLTGNGIVRDPEPGSPTPPPPRVPTGLLVRRRTRTPEGGSRHGSPPHRNHDRLRSGGARS